MSSNKKALMHEQFQKSITLGSFVETPKGYGYVKSFSPNGHSVMVVLSSKDPCTGYSGDVFGLYEIMKPEDTKLKDK